MRYVIKENESEPGSSSKVSMPSKNWRPPIKFARHAKRQSHCKWRNRAVAHTPAGQGFVIGLIAKVLKQRLPAEKDFGVTRQES